MSISSHMEAKKQKILFVITKSNWGGAQRYVYDLASSLPREKFDIAVALGGTGEPNAPMGELEKKLSADNIRTTFVKSFMRDISIFREFAATFELIKIFKTEKPDVVHLNSSKAGALGAIAGRFVGVKKIIFTSHGLAYDEDRNIFAKAAIFLITWITFLLCHKVIVISKDNETHAKRLPFCRGKIVLIYNGILDIEFLSRSDARTFLAEHTAFTIPENTVCIGIIAELTRNKGISYLIDAIKILKEGGQNVFTLIIGEGEERKSFEAQITNLKLENEIKLLGFVPEANKYLKAFDIFVLPSVKEGLPYVLIESGLASVPVIASNISGARDIIEDRATGLLFISKDANDLAQKISILVQDDTMKRFFSDKLKQKIDNTFSIAQMSADTSKLYTA